LGVALKSLENLGLRGKIPIISLAERLEEIFYPGDSYPMYLDKRSETMKVIIHLRDEAHRFGLSFHRNQRSKNAITSKLDEIPGIGDKTKTKLINHFKSVKRIFEAPEQEIEQLIGKAKAKILQEYVKQ